MIDSNVGGYFAPFLKFAGFDALEIQGKAAEDVIIFIDGDNGKVTIETAPLEGVDSHLLGNMLTEMYADDEKARRGISVMSAGQAAEHIRYALINSTWYDVRRKEIRLKQAGQRWCGAGFSRQKDQRDRGALQRYARRSQRRGRYGLDPQGGPADQQRDHRSRR